MALDLLNSMRVLRPLVELAERYQIPIRWKLSMIVRIILISLMLASASLGQIWPFNPKPERRLVILSEWVRNDIDGLDYADLNTDGFDDLIIACNPKPPAAVYLYFNRLLDAQMVLKREFFYRSGFFSHCSL